jgi:hypothetical protein
LTAKLKEYQGREIRYLGQYDSYVQNAGQINRWPERNDRQEEFIAKKIFFSKDFA